MIDSERFERLRECLDGAWACLQPGPPKHVRCDGCQYEWSTALREIEAARALLSSCLSPNLEGVADAPF